jgi:hypothetical protein
VKVSRRRGRTRLQVEPIEAALLARLLADLDELLSPADDDHPDPESSEDPVRARLNPAGYRGDIDAQREFRALTAATLEEERRERIGACRADLEAAGAGGGNVELDDDGGERWLRILNDLRLALGTRLRVSEDDDPLLPGSGPDSGSAADDGEEDESDPSGYGREVYVWLTAVQDSLVHTLMH